MVYASIQYQVMVEGDKNAWIMPQRQNDWMKKSIYFF